MNERLLGLRLTGEQMVEEMELKMRSLLREFSFPSPLISLSLLCGDNG